MSGDIQRDVVNEHTAAAALKRKDFFRDDGFKIGSKCGKKEWSTAWFLSLTAFDWSLVQELGLHVQLTLRLCCLLDGYSSSSTI